MTGERVGICPVIASRTLPNNFIHDIRTELCFRQPPPRVPMVIRTRWSLGAVSPIVHQLTIQWAAAVQWLVKSKGLTQTCARCSCNPHVRCVGVDWTEAVRWWSLLFNVVQLHSNVLNSGWWFMYVGSWGKQCNGWRMCSSLVRCVPFSTFIHTLQLQ